MIKMTTDGAIVAVDVVDGEIRTEEIGVGPAAPKPEKVKSKGGEENGYPFLTKAQIADRIGNDAGFVRQAIGILYANQTADEREEKDTKYKNRRGFMSSHAVTGTKLAEKLLSGAGWTAIEEDQARAIAGRYTRQLAVHFREEKLAEAPELSAKAACFFTPQPTKQG